MVRNCVSILTLLNLLWGILIFCLSVVTGLGSSYHYLSVISMNYSFIYLL